MNEQYTIKEAADFLGISIDTLRRWDASGKLRAVRDANGKHRRYSLAQLEDFLLSNSINLAEKWVRSDRGEKPNNLFYCQDSSVFQGRLYKLRSALSKKTEIESIYSLLILIVGEIGDNSFGHNIGNWPDVNGIFFAYNIQNRAVVLADRGQGLFKTLSRVKPGLKDDAQAIDVAFTEIISGRSPESRGNGLKTVRAVIEKNPISLFFQSGGAELKLDKNSSKLKIKKSPQWFRGCLAIIKY